MRKAIMIVGISTGAGTDMGFPFGNAVDLLDLAERFPFDVLKFMRQLL